MLAGRAEDDARLQPNIPSQHVDAAFYDGRLSPHKHVRLQDPDIHLQRPPQGQFNVSLCETLLSVLFLLHPVHISFKELLVMSKKSVQFSLLRALKCSCTEPLS